jgi:hypothetical protein
MRNLMIAFLMMIGFTSVEAQISFEGNKMITVNDEKRDVKEMDIKIHINADTTEIEVYSKVVKFKETIGEFYSSFEDGDYKILVYKLKDDEILVLHFDKGNMFSVVFQQDVYNSLEFEI